jgi:hypothetical protein
MGSIQKLHHQQFLFTFFAQEAGNEEKHINGFVLFKHWDGNNLKWRVDIFTEESFKSMKMVRSANQSNLFNDGQSQTFTN